MESWDCLSMLPVATLPVALALQCPGELELGTSRARAGDSLCHGEIRAPFQRLQEEGSEP